MARGAKKKAARKAQKRKPRTQANARSRTVKRAAMLKHLSSRGGKKRAATKKRLAQAGASGDEW
jgi:hypothetical protein